MELSNVRCSLTRFVCTCLCYLASKCTATVKPGWGTPSHWKVVQGCATLKTPFFRQFFKAPETHHFKPFSNSTGGGGWVGGMGTLTLESSTRMCHPQDPLFQAIFFSSGDPPFRALFQLQTPTSIFRKNLHFQAHFFPPILAKFWFLRHKSWWKFVPETPV